MIKKGYWFGEADGKATVAVCPMSYCDFNSCSALIKPQNSVTYHQREQTSVGLTDQVQLVVIVKMAILYHSMQLNV